jgi:very-long-chain (3R)-3-hydroxyacyl-CoA dehydratase
MLLRAYLITYNLACILGWGYINWIVASHLTGPHRGGNAALWAAVGAPLKLVQTAALLEVLHAALGWVRSNLVTAFIQGVARNIVLWTMIAISPAAQSSWALPLCA